MRGTRNCLTFLPRSTARARRREARALIERKFHALAARQTRGARTVDATEKRALECRQIVSARARGARNVRAAGVGVRLPDTHVGLVGARGIRRE